MRRSTLLTLAGFVLLVLAAINYIPSWFGSAPQGMEQMGAAPVSVAQVMARRVQSWKSFSGRLVAVDRAEVRPQVSGIIQSVHFTNGAQVKKGDLLFTIDPRPFMAEVGRAEGALASAEAEHTLASKEMERAEGLIQNKVIPQREYERRQNALRVAKASLQSAKAAMQVAKLNLAYTKVTAPISGMVSRAEITAGNLVEINTGAPLLTTVVANSPIYADFEMDETTFLTYAQRAEVDDDAIPVRLELSNGGIKTGFIESFDNHLDSATGTIRARAVFENADGTLVPGLFARITVGGASDIDAILITDRAVGTDQNKKFVLVVGDDNIVAYREVKLGGMADKLRIVTEGLKAGEKIVVNGLQRARPGTPVIPEVVPMDAPEAAPAAAPAAAPTAEAAPEAAAPEEAE